MAVTTGGIYLLNNLELVELIETAYETEDLLQGYLDDHPKLLAGEQIDPDQPRRWLLIRREASIPDSDTSGGRWAVDHLFVDQDGIPTLVEVKRSTDTRLRREVVGQMLDYAANAVSYWPIEHLIAQFEATCVKKKLDPDAEVAALIGSDASIDDFWHGVKTNLQAGRIRMIFVADIIPTELRVIVEFLNEQLDPAEVYAVEVKKYTDGNATAFVPRVIGATVQAQQHKGTKRSERWTVESFVATLTDKTTALERTEGQPEQLDRAQRELAAAKRLITWAEGQNLQLVGGQGVNASLSPKLNHHGSLKPIFHIYGYGRVTVPLNSLHPPYNTTDRRQEIFQQLNQALGGILPDADVDHSQPSFDLALLADDGAFKRFVDVWDGFIAAHDGPR